MEFEIEGKCIVRLETSPSQKKSRVLGIDFNLDVSRELDRSGYIDKDGLPNEHGSKALTMVFVQGLIGNIHYSHKKGFKNDAEHLRYIISELERGFIENTNISSGEF